jgi:coenzyme PQQ precursor peptide PqqA
LRKAAPVIYINSQPRGWNWLGGGLAERSQIEKAKRIKEETAMSWTTPTLVEICIGLEINGYLPAEI